MLLPGLIHHQRHVAAAEPPGRQVDGPAAQQPGRGSNAHTAGRDAGGKHPALYFGKKPPRLMITPPDRPQEKPNV